MRYKLLATLLVPAAALLTGCASDKTAPATGSPTTAAAVANAGPTGAELWANNCSRCHNIRPPQSYNDAQWEAVVRHMRFRADLTGREQREITKFLQANH
jgi:cytochrome c5